MVGVSTAQRYVALQLTDYASTQSHLLPPQLLRLFAPRAPLPYLKPVGRDPDVPLKSLARKPPTLGVYDTLKLIREEKEAAENKAFEKGENPDGEDEVKPVNGKQDLKEEGEDKNGAKVVKKESKEDDLITTLPVNERIKARRELRRKKQEKDLVEGIKNCMYHHSTLTCCRGPSFSSPASPVDPQTDNPAEDEEIVGDPYKTLFVARLPYELTESDLRREFEMYGPLERIRLVRNKDGKSRGYAFLVYERERDMKGGLHCSSTFMLSYR
jgi:U1 small nuclear ribonucleoprotein 70kDa